MNSLSKRVRGGALPKLLLLLVFVGLLLGLFYWKSQHGVTGVVVPMPVSTGESIAFLRQDGKQSSLVLAKADGTGETVLLSDDHNKQSLCWSPDGQALCYSAEVTEERGRANQLFIHDGRGSRQLTQGSVSKDLPQWRPTGMQIGFLTGGTVKIIGTNGEGMEQIYPAPHKGGGESEADHEDEADEGLRKPPIQSFRWSPDGAGIAGIQITEGEQAATIGQGRWWDKPTEGDRQDQPTVVEPETLVLLPGLTEKAQVLYGTNSKEISFDWFPDSKRIAVSINSRGGNHGIGIFRADETRLTPTGVFTSRGYTVAPKSIAVSPDSNWVAFELYRLSSAESSELMGIGVVSTDETKAVKVDSEASISKIRLVVKGNARRPQWSPDGTRILYTSPNANLTGNDLFVVPVEGGAPINLTKGRGDNFDAVWSPARR